MSVWAEILWILLGVGLVAYALTGGADFGAGVWSVLANGPRAEQQRAAARHAIAPIWEANHVWLIFVIVVMFSAFPRGFSTIGTALHVPIALALLGMVLRGAAFSFHAYGIQSRRMRSRWESIFAWSSVATPVFLGTVVAGVSSGSIRVVDGQVTTGFFAGWTSPFAWLVGAFALALFSMLAAAYLAAETRDDLAGDFRRRTLVAELCAGILAALVLWRATIDAPILFEQLMLSAWAVPLQAATALLALSTIALSWRWQLGWARFTAAAQVALVVLGWGAAMDGHIVVPDVSIDSAGSRPEVLPSLVIALGSGAVVLGPALWYLYRVFKGRPRSDGGEQPSAPRRDR